MQLVALGESIKKEMAQMAVQMKDLMLLPELQSFSLVAGKSGLKNVVQQVSYFDHRDDLASRNDTAVHYDLPGDLYLSNLSTCYQSEEDMLDFFRHLVLVESSGLIIDHHYLKELPAAVIALCNEAALPVLMQGREKISYSQIIYAIMQRILLDKEEELVEMKISYLLGMQAPSTEAGERARLLFPYLKKHYIALYFDSPADAAFARGRANWFCMPYHGAVVLIVSETSKKKLLASLDYAVGQIQMSGCCLGISEPCQSIDYASNTLREAIAALEMCGKLEQKIVYYQDLRVYSLLLPHKDSLYVRRFRDCMLNEILAYDKEYSTDYYKTVCIFVANHGSFQSTAREMHIHENSVRYRINKTIETFFSGQNLMDFYADISVAIKIDRLL